MNTKDLIEQLMIQSKDFTKEENKSYEELLTKLYKPIEINILEL